jgi:type I restriction enzyme S subunit
MRDGWIETSLGEIAEVIGGGTPATAIAEYWDGEIVWLTPTEITSQDGKMVSDSIRKITDLGFKNSGAQMLKKDSVILTSRASVGYVALAGKDLCTNQGFQSLAPKPSVLAKFLMFWIQQNRSEFESRSAGSTFKEISKSNVKSIKLQLPPLPEQKRIVDLISSVDSYKGALEQQLESAKKSRNAVLHELLTAGGDDWVEHKLVDMFEIYQPQTIAKSLMSDDGEFIVFGANGPIGRYHEFNHEEPEVVVTCRGATCGTINMTPPKTWITGNAMVVSPKTSGVSKDFLYWALVAGVDIQSVISGSAQPQITREGLAPVKIKIPPLSRQEEIVDLITGFELTIRELEESLRKTKTLRSGLLSDLLSGEHEIPASYDKVIGAA